MTREEFDELYWSIKPNEEPAPAYYGICPGDEIALGIGNFKTTPRVGERYENTPLKIIGINYLKNGELHEKKWWQFWIRKKRWIVILEMEQQGEVLNVSDKGYPVNMFVSHVGVSNPNAHIPDQSGKRN